MAKLVPYATRGVPPIPITDHPYKQQYMVQIVIDHDPYSLFS